MKKTRHHLLHDNFRSGTLPPMSFKINVRGIEIIASSASEAAALVRELTEQPTPKIGRPLKAPGLFDVTPTEENNTAAVATSFLTAITHANGEGASAEDLMKVLNVDHSKGIGGRSVRINNLLRRLKFDPEDVYKSERLPEGRFWKPGPKVDEAIQSLKRGG